MKKSYTINKREYFMLWFYRAALPLLAVGSLLTACGDDDGSDGYYEKPPPTTVGEVVNTTDGTGDPAVEGSVETMNGQDYVCFRYESHDRGGLWCTAVDEYGKPYG